MIHISGQETPREIISIAYGLEEGLREFYEMLKEKSEDTDIKSVAARLATIEEGHKNRLFKLYQSYAEESIDQDEFESTVLVGVMEGGYTTAEFIEQNKSVIQSKTGILELAMMLETQALDLYLRYMHQSENQDAQNVLAGLADEEKLHLKYLGESLEKKM